MASTDQQRPRRAVHEILVDDATWATGTIARRQEWRLALDEVVIEGEFDVRPSGEARRLLLTVRPTALDIAAQGERGRPLERCELPLDQLRPAMKEYLEICIEMGRLAVGGNSPRLEALDIAKRITHDEAGEIVQSLLGDLRPDHATARRMFTLFVTLLYDTTRLMLSHPPQPLL
jgi:uncharacterized protein (UPF0262 family)